MAYEYKTWRYANRDTVRQRRAQQFRTTAGAYRDGTVGEQEDQPYGASAARSLDDFRSRSQRLTRGDDDDEEEESGGGGFFGKVKDIGGGIKDVAGDVGGGVLKALDVPAEYVGRPAFAIASGQLGAERRVDSAGNAYREKPGFGDVFESIGKAFTQDPRDTYGEARQAFHERLANPEFEDNTWARIALEAGSDPLMFIPAGSVGAIGRRLPQGAARTLLTSRRSPIGALGEGPTRAAVPGVIAGSAAGGELGERSGLPGGETIGRIAGAVGGGLASARALGRWDEPLVVNAAEKSNTMPDGMEMAGTEVYKFDELSTRPELFQARDTDPGKPYKESKVRDIVEKYDPLLEEPGLLVRDASSGDLVIVRGHHRSEAFRRMAEAGDRPDTAEWMVVNADLTNAEHVSKLKAIAPLTNYGSSRTNLREDIRAVRQYMENEGSTEGLKEAMHLKSQEATDLVHLSTLPDDVIDRMVEGDIPHQNAAEVARIANMVDLPDQELRGALNYYVFGDGRRFTRGSVRLSLEKASRMIEKAREAKRQRAQTDMFGSDAFAGIEEVTITDVARELTAHYQELARERNRLRSLRMRLGQVFKDDPDAELQGMVSRLEDEVDAKVAKIEADLEDAEARLTARLTGEDQAGPRPEDSAGAGQPGEGAAPLPGQEGLFGDADQTVKQVDLEGNVTDTFKTEAELNGYVPEQGAMDLEGRRQQWEGTGEQAPIRAYHATDKDFTEFDLSQAGSATDEGLLGRGIYLSTDPNVRRGAEKLVAADLTLNRPLRVTMQELEIPAKNAAVNKALGTEGLTGAELSAELRRQGYDGVILDYSPTGYAHQEIMVLDPAQAKTVPEAAGTAARGIAPTDEGMVRTGEPEPEVPPREEPQAAAPDDAVPPPEEPEFNTSGEAPPLDKSNDWTILGLDPNKTYTPEEIKAAFRRQARQYHPDINPTASATEDMQAINAAFDRMFAGMGRSGPEPGPGARQAGGTQQGPADASGGRYQSEQRQRAKTARERMEEEILHDFRKYRHNMRQQAFDGFGGGRGNADLGGGGGGDFPRGRGNQAGFGEEPTIDLLNTVPRATTISRAQKRSGKLPAKLGQKVRSAFGKLESEDVREKVDPFVKESQRIEQQIEHTAEALVFLERVALKIAGIELRQVDGVTHLFADGRDMGLAEDIIEGTTAQAQRAYAQMTPVQHQAIARIGKTNADVNGTIRFHGGNPRIDEEIAGDYFGRRAIAREYQNEAGETVRVETSRKGPSTSKSRVMESIEEGLEAGFKYEDPWEARTAILRGKLRDAEDAYLAKSLKPLAKKKITSTFGLSQAKNVRATAGSWFDPDVAKRIEEGFSQAQRGVPERTIRAINNVLTPLRASFDMSATFQQGLRLWLTDPKSAGKYWWTVMRSLADDTVYDNAVMKLHQTGPGLDYHVRKGARFTGDDFGEFVFSTGALERVGKVGVPGKVAKKGFEKSNQAFSRTLNLYRLHMGNTQFERLKAAGLSGDELDTAMTVSWKGINRAFGWTDTQPTTIESAAIFAPRYTRASVETVMKAISDGGIEGQMARTHMGLLLAEGAGLVWLLNEARGYETEFDPRDPNFLRIRNAGGLDVSPFGTYNTLFRAIAQAAGGSDFEGGVSGRVKSPWKFVEGKMSPGLKLVYEPFIKQETYLGEPQDVLGDPMGVIREQAKSTVPFGLQNLFEEGPAAAAVGSIGVSSTPVTPAEKRDFTRTGSPGGVNLPGLGNVQTTGRDREGLAQEMFGKPYEELSGTEKSQVNENPEVQRHQEDVDRNTLSRTGDRTTATQARLEAERKTDELSAALERGEITGNQWREQYQQIQTELRAVRDTLDFGGNDDVVSGWFDLYDKAELPDGRIDYGTLEALQAEYEAKHPEVIEELDKVTGANDNATVREYRQARELAGEYYSMPAYRGMGLEESRRASAILAAASDMVAYGFARDRQDALRKLRTTDPVGVLSAQRALRQGPNPMRERFRRSPANRLFGKFYGDVPTSLAS